MGLKYPDSTMSTILAMAICVFCTWLEVKFLTNHSSREVTRWFHKCIVCRFGAPVAVCMDHFTETRAEFHQYLERMGILHYLISVAHPRANGLVEHYNGVIRHGLCKQLAAMPGIHPKEALPEFLGGLRMLPTRIGLSPFLVIYK